MFVSRFEPSSHDFMRFQSTFRVIAQSSWRLYKCAVQPLTVGSFLPRATFATALMLFSFRITGGTLRRGVAVLAVIGQLLGTVGIIPVRADSSEDSLTPYPCKDHPCGCRSAARCWAAACCCYTMQQKVAWAAEHGIKPPDHAVRLAAEEAALERRDNGYRAVPFIPCCSAKQGRESGLDGRQDQESIPGKSRDGSKAPASHHEVDWVAGLFAQQCQGQGFDGLGFLNIGIPPAPPVTWTFESVIVNTCSSFDQSPIPMPVPPLLPPPKN